MPPNIVGRPMEILVVEDDLLQARLALEAIEQADFKHRTGLVRDGQEALEYLKRRGIYRRAPRPDLILLDLRLPKVDGLDVLAELYGDDHLRTIPVVVLTASEDNADRQACEQFHVTAYRTKPVNLQRFLELLRTLREHWHQDVILPSAART